MKIRFILLLLFMPLMIFSQKGFTFKVEDLKQPDNLLRLYSYDNVLKNLILLDQGYLRKDVDSQKDPFNIVAKSRIKDSLVNFGAHPFFNGMYQAYADHRPFMISPDMIWLLISQGFARHVNANAEELRNMFVDFKGKVSLVVRDDRIVLKNPNSPWEKVFPVFASQIGEKCGVDLVNALTCDFSTTTLDSKVASEITIMEATKPYFEFIVMRVVCGIPKITIEGTPEDWQKVLTKSNYLRKYKLDWWIDEIEPILKNIVSASQKKVDTAFWRNMFKYHSVKEYGSPNTIDGWIVKFFPYDKMGKRNNLKEIVDRDNLPNEMVKVDLTHIVTGGDKDIITPLELWAGFVGLQQNSGTFALKPQIGWMIRKKDVDNKAFVEKLNSRDLIIRVQSVPKELLTVSQINSLWIIFTDEINIPDEMGKMKIIKFRMSGKISDAGIKRICGLFPGTILIINDKSYYTNSTNKN
jgi:hypothetical protein